MYGNYLTPKLKVDKDLTDCSRSYFLVMLVVTVLFSTAWPSLRHRRITVNIRTLWEMGFGKLQPYTYLVIGLPQDDPLGLITNVILANLPQFILSVLYVLYNAIMSVFLVQREFSHMCKEKKRKPLRVSEPIGIQRGSYFISLPLRYGIPLYASCGVMHWMISQSLFLARITALDTAGSPDSTNSFSTCGYSPSAIFICESPNPPPLFCFEEGCSIETHKRLGLSPAPWSCSYHRRPKSQCSQV